MTLIMPLEIHLKVVIFHLFLKNKYPFSQNSLSNNLLLENKTKKLGGRMLFPFSYTNKREIIVIVQTFHFELSLEVSILRPPLSSKK